MNSILYEKAQRITESIASLPCAGPFRNPVPEEEGALYYKKIKDPVDLSSILGRILLREYQYLSEWQNDMYLILKNSRAYNGPSACITYLAEIMIHKFEKMVIANFPITLRQWTDQFRHLSCKLQNLYVDDSMPKTIEAATLISGTFLQQSLEFNSISSHLKQTDNKTYPHAVIPLSSPSPKRTPPVSHHINLRLISKSKKSHQDFIPSPIEPVFIDCTKPVQSSDEIQMYYQNHSNYYGFPREATPVSSQPEIDDEDSDDFWLQTRRFIYDSFPEIHQTLESNSNIPSEEPIPIKANHSNETQSPTPTRRRRGRPKKNFTDVESQEPKPVLQKKPSRQQVEIKIKKKKRIESTDESSDEFTGGYYSRKKKYVDYDYDNARSSYESSSNSEDDSHSLPSSPTSPISYSQGVKDRNHKMSVDLGKITDSDYIAFMEAANQLNGQNDQKEMAELIHRMEPDFPLDLEAIYPAVDITQLKTKTIMRLIDFTKKKFRERGKEYPLC